MFQDVAQGNGTFFTAASGANTGSGIIDSGSVANPSAWVSSTYTLSFTSATTYEVRDATTALVTSGTYTSGGAIAFNGAQITVTGQPATGDTFTIAPSATEDMFATISKLVTTLGRTTTQSADGAQFATEMGNTLTQLDSALDHASSIRSQVGARLQVLDTTASSRDDRDLELKGVPLPAAGPGLCGRHHKAERPAGGPPGSAELVREALPAVALQLPVAIVMQFMFATSAGSSSPPVHRYRMQTQHGHPNGAMPQVSVTGSGFPGVR